MARWVRHYRGIAVVFWVLLAVTVVVFVSEPTDRSGWDMRVYGSAIASLRAGHDPYVDGMEVQREFHRTLAQHPKADLPYTYLYSPMTLAPLRWVGRLPLRWSGGMYWVAYIAAVLGMAWAWMQMVEATERVGFLLLEPALLFFPGLMLEDDVLFSGNIAYLLYGLIFATAVKGWRRGEWRWFYAAVLVASIFKFPMLTLLVIPVVSGKRQWGMAGVTGAVAGLVMLLQPRIWQGEFQHYLQALQLEFAYNHGFGTSPAGVAANVVYPAASYVWVSGVVYLLYAVPVVGALLYLARRFWAGEISVERWAPVVLVGALLLNPRLMEYDVAAIALPMALIVWRCVARGRSLGVGVGLMAVVMGVINGFGIWAWKPAEAVVLVGVFAVGCWELREGVDYRAAAEGEAVVAGT